jgi:hypothetical protein
MILALFPDAHFRPPNICDRCEERETEYGDRYCDDCKLDILCERADASLDWMMNK